MPVSTRRVSITLGKEETAMLAQLVRATGKTKPAIVRELIAHAYAKLVPKLKSKAGFGFAVGVLAPAPTKKSPPKKR